MAARKKNMTKDAAASQPGDDGAEVAGDRVEVVTYAAAIAVAKGFGMVCTRVPGSRPDRRRQTVWRGGATDDSVGLLLGPPRCEGLPRLVLPRTPRSSRGWCFPGRGAAPPGGARHRAGDTPPPRP